ncbi:hypothetical protein QAD02_022402 [Eretmocerus hayati]|uniref:Uncharacterized protein n=1 Tax=Eretmocerus hayati TaxID=131215 RepID=A0ACC2PUH3_9HYME|nr:hypothetical protein QAD02_022402 [Eretmocerus hayati]
MATCIDINSISSSQLQELVSKAKDWVLMNGICIRPKKKFDENTAEIAPFSLLPSSFPEKEFQRAMGLQVSLNKLMHKVAYDYEFLSETLKTTTRTDNFTSKLFNIYHTVHSEGLAQKLSLGLMRSDYMLHSDENNIIKLVEINTIASGLAGIAANISDYYRFILIQLGEPGKTAQIPKNSSDVGFAHGFIMAWRTYSKKEAAILFVVEEIESNIFDHRTLEFKIREMDPEIKIIRRSIRNLTELSYMGLNGELFVNDVEIAVVYFRTAYQPEAYPSEREWNLRLLIERSQAIKCPSIQYQLAGTKKVQQQLAVDGVLERFIKDQNEIDRIREIFVGTFSLDSDENGASAVSRALNDPRKYVLKPQREGGGNNLFGDEVASKLREMNEVERSAYILMERIKPPKQKNYLIQAGKDIKLQDCVSELGIFGVTLGDDRKLILNTTCDYLLRSKPADADEGGMMTGIGAIDTTYLIN